MAERVTYDFEVGYLNGTTQFLTAEEGRDSIAVDDQRLKVVLRPDEQTFEEYLVNRSALAYLHTIKRVHPEPSTAESNIRLVGETP